LLSWGLIVVIVMINPKLTTGFEKKKIFVGLGFNVSNFYKIGSFIYKPRIIVKYELKQLMGKIVIERFKMKISVIIGCKLNGFNMLCTVPLCGLSLGLVSVGVQAVNVIFYALRNYYFFVY
jgi:hypothetical protein